MAKVTQVGPGRKTTGTIDGITYVTRNGVTYARSAPTMPASAYNTPAAKLRQAIFKMIQMHLKFHLRTIKQTFTPKGNGSASNRYYSLNGKALSKALEALAELYVEGEDVTITDVEAAISAYAQEHPTSIKIASKSGYAEVYLTGDWPETITLNALSGDSTVIIIVNENGVQTTINADGTVTTGTYNGNTGGGTDTGSSSNSGTGGSGSNTGNNENSGSSETPETLETPVITGTTPFTESTSVTMSGPDGAEIHYTTDGSNPSAESTLYSEALTLTETTTVKAIAIKSGSTSSVASKTFTQSTGGSGGFETGS